MWQNNELFLLGKLQKEGLKRWKWFCRRLVLIRGKLTVIHIVS